MEWYLVPGTNNRDLHGSHRPSEPSVISIIVQGTRYGYLAPVPRTRVPGTVLTTAPASVLVPRYCTVRDNKGLSTNTYQVPGTGTCADNFAEFEGEKSWILKLPPLANANHPPLASGCLVEKHRSARSPSPSARIQNTCLTGHQAEPADWPVDKRSGPSVSLEICEKLPLTAVAFVPLGWRVVSFVWRNTAQQEPRGCGPVARLQLTPRHRRAQLPPSHHHQYRCPSAMSTPSAVLRSGAILPVVQAIQEHLARRFAAVRAVTPSPPLPEIRLEWAPRIPMAEYAWGHLGPGLRQAFMDLLPAAAGERNLSCSLPEIALATSLLPKSHARRGAKELARWLHRLHPDFPSCFCPKLQGCWWQAPSSLHPGNLRLSATPLITPSHSKAPQQAARG